MPRRKMPKVADCAEALTRAHGIVTHAARALGVSREWLHKRIANSPTLRQARDEARSAVKDVAEYQLAALLADPDHPHHFHALKFYLTQQGADRGYGPSPQTLNINQRVSGADGGPVEVVNVERLSTDALVELAGALLPDAPDGPGEGDT